MTKLISLTLSWLILIQSFTISFTDFVEMDELIEHAQFHSEQHGDNFIVFLSKHYGELKAEHNKQHQEEKEDHERLPFQHQTQHSQISSFVLLSARDFDVQPEFISLHKEPNFHYLANYPSLFGNTPFQPPRNV
ncbi:MAG: hypothetical protein WBM83_13065 [Flavobacteriaceae bacterium]